ncbi:MAG: hypothetical protein NC117_09555 [Pseudoflavonifractor sp.]|nr:hypothetical protein [Pseudoflavonifractor sp.]
MKRLYISAIALLAAMSSAAQGLTKEIVIEKENVPREREATRLAIAPAISLPPVKTKALKISDGGVTTEVPAWLTTLEPAQGDAITGQSPYRGYVSAGYFPNPIAGVSAGYRLMATKATALDLYGQFTFNRYKRDSPAGADVAIRRSALTIGALLRQKIGQSSMLNADIDWNLYNYNITTLTANGHNQHANNCNISLGWQSKAGVLDYHVTAGYGYFGFGNADTPLFSYVRGTTDLKPLKENAFNVTLGASTAASEVSTVGIDADASFVSYNTTGSLFISADPVTLPVLTVGDGFTRGAIGVNPYYSYAGDNVDARVGIKADFFIHSGKVVHVTPDVRLSWRPAAILGIWAEATGGDEMNSLSSLFNDIPYMSAAIAPGHNSMIAYDIKGGFTIGPCRGFTGRVYGGYASARDWMMPTGATYGNEGTLYHDVEAVNLKGWHFGVSAAYDYKGLAGIEAAFEMAPSDYDKGYYMWRDRAKRLVSARLYGSPIKGLDLSLAYRLRADRSSYGTPAPSAGQTTATALLRDDLGNVSSLDLNASYAITRQLSVFCNINNLLNGDWQECYGVTTAPINGLIGVGYKF